MNIWIMGLVPTLVAVAVAGVFTLFYWVLSHVIMQVRWSRRGRRSRRG